MSKGTTPSEATTSTTNSAGWPLASMAARNACRSLVTPLAYCRYGCPTGALFKLLRFTGDADRFGARDWLAAACVALVLLFAPG